MKPVDIAVLAIAKLLLFSAVPSAEASPVADRGDHGPLKVGRTGILCYTEPCPRHGIGPSQGRVSPATLLWSGNRPPPMAGRKADLERIRNAYLSSCTMVDGIFDNGVLQVNAVIGTC